MRKLSTRVMMTVSMGVIGLHSSFALAGSIDQTNDLPAPGILALVAGGVVAAIAVARRKKK